MPPATKISQLPDEIRLWLEDELSYNGCRNYEEVTAVLNRKLMELSYGGEISREAVRRFGVKLSAKIDLRDRLMEHIRQELDPERTLPPLDWTRAVVSAIGFLNYRTLTDLQCQETVSVREHGTFIRSLIQSHKYEQILNLQPLKPEEVPAPSPAAAPVAQPTHPPSAPLVDSPPPQPSLLEGEGADGFASPLRGEAPAQPVEGVHLEALPPENTEKHGTTHNDPPPPEMPDPDSHSPEPPPAGPPGKIGHDADGIPLPGSPERAALTVTPAELVMKWPGVSKSVRRRVIRLCTKLRDRPQDKMLQMRLTWALEQAGYEQDVYRRRLMNTDRGREKLMAMEWKPPL